MPGADCTKPSPSRVPFLVTLSTSLQQRFQLSRDLDRVLALFHEGAELAGQLAEDMGRLRETEPTNSDPKQASEVIETVQKQVDELNQYFGKGWKSERARFLDLFGQLQSSSRRPTEAQKRSARALEKELKQRIEELNSIVTGQWPQLRRQLRERELNQLSPVEWRSQN